MEKLHELMGPTQSLIVLGVLAVVLIWLILKAVKQGGDKRPVEMTAQNSQLKPESTSPSAHHSQTQATDTADASVVNQVKPIKNEATVILPATQPVTLAAIPEDSVLRRHYLTEQASKKAVMSNPVPTDSILRRHYEAMQQPVVLTNQRLKKTNTIEQAVNKEASAVVQHTGTKPSQFVAPDNTLNTLVLPEDSVLRRHVLSQLQTEINRS